MDDFRDPIFKGCTRPAMFLGVPMVPFLVVSGVFVLLGAWLNYLVSPLVSVVLALIYVPLLITMQQITRKDDQRLAQVFMRLRMRHRHGAARRFWNAISYGPMTFTRRKL